MSYRLQRKWVTKGGLDALHQHVRCCVVLAISRERIKKPQALKALMITPRQCVGTLNKCRIRAARETGRAPETISLSARRCSSVSTRFAKS